MKEKMMLKLASLSEEEFEEFKKNFSGEELKGIVALRFWGKMKYNKVFRDKVQNTLAKETYNYSI